MPSTAVGSINTDAEPVWLTSSVPIPAVLSARTQAAERAMVQAAGRTLTGTIPGNAATPITYGPATEYGPAPPKGPYSNRNQEQEKNRETTPTTSDRH